MRLDSDSNATLSIAPSRPRSGLYYGQIPIPDLTGINSDSTHPMKEDVKKKSFSPPLEKTRVWMTYIQPHLILGGVIGLVALARRTFQRQCQPQLLVPTQRFHKTVMLDAIRFRSYAS